MDSDDLSLIDIGHEDDSLLKNLPPDDAGRFACSPLVAAGSACYSRPPKSILKGKVHYGEVGSTLPDNNKENLNESINTKLGSSNLSLEPQKMKRNRKAGAYNLRKSLAWDKAFSTEEGVLSTLELSMICGTPSQLDGKHLPAIFEEPRTPMHYNTIPTDSRTFESKSYRKLRFSSNKEKRSVEGSILKQKPLASGSLKSKKSASTTSSKSSERKEGTSSRNSAPTSNKRLLSTSPAKPLSQLSKMSRMPSLKPDAHLSSTAAGSSGASCVKRNRIAPPIPSAQKQSAQKGGFNTRSTSNGPKIVSQLIPKPSKCSDQRTRKSMTVPCTQEQSSTSHKVSNTKPVTCSKIVTGKMLPVGLEANDGACKAAISVQANTGNTSNIQQSIQHQVAKPSGLRMPSPSLRFFGESKIPKATMDRIPAPGPAQPCSVSTIDVPKIHDELVHVKKDDLIVTVPDLLDGKPLKNANKKFLEDVEKHLVELEHTCLSTQGLDGEDVRSASPITECRYNDASFLQRYEDKLITPCIDNKSDCQAKQQQSDDGSNCWPEMAYRIYGCKEVQELHCSSHATDEISQVHAELSSNIEDLLNRSFSLERISQSDVIDSAVPEIGEYKPLVGKETLSASLENIVDTKYKQQELEDSSLRIVTDEDKATEPFPLEVVLSADLEHVDLSAAEYTNQTGLTHQNADVKLQMSTRAYKSASQVDTDICNVEFSLSRAQRLGSTDAELSTLESDEQHMISDELLREPLMPDEDVSVICDDTQLIDSSNMEMLVNKNKNGCQTSNSPATNNSEACSPHSSVDLSFPLKVSEECSNDKNKVEAENHMILIYDYASGNDSMSDQEITTTSAANCDTMVSISPCKYESTIVRKESMDETGEQVQLTTHLEDIHDIVNEDEKTSSRIVKDGVIQSQLVIRPPGDVAPFSDEWLAAVEAAGEDILTLKTGPVQNSPPAKLSPEPSPWSPVKKKNNQGIGPYDCTKYSTGQH